VTHPSPIFHVTVLPRQTSMGCHVTYQDTNKLGLDIANWERDIAIHGMVSLDVTAALACKANTGVHFADQDFTLSSSAIPSSDLSIINMPFIPTKWEMSLNSILPFNNFSDVPIGIHIWALHLLLLTHTLLLITTLQYPSQTTSYLISTKNFWLDVILAPPLALG
jgi:hypothetical protein